MRLQRIARDGSSLVELLVAVGIAAVLIGLLVPAVQKIRMAAVRSQNANKLRQVSLATHACATGRGGDLPAYGLHTKPLQGLFEPILPFIEGDATITMRPKQDGTYVPAYQSPADPSMALAMQKSGDASYAANYQVFRVNANLSRSCPDGTSNTIALGERYAHCRRTGSEWSLSVAICTDTSNTLITCVDPGGRRPTFADPTYDDVMPVRNAPGGGTVPSSPGRTFQITPPLDQADYRVLQATHPAGVLVGLLDGGVRTVSGGVSPQVYWSAITPDGGEVGGGL